jgi:ribosome maturation factor RimP
MDLAGRVETLIGPTVEAMGFSLVRVQVLGQNRPRLQIMAERTDGESMLVEDCAAISRAVSAVLDVEDPIAGAYTLEVSSPGIDRPLVRLADFDRFAGFEAKVEMDLAVDGRRRFQGRLLGTEGDAVRLRMEDSEVVLPYADIRRAKLVLTEELLATGGH